MVRFEIQVSNHLLLLELTRFPDDLGKYHKKKFCYGTISFIPQHLLEFEAYG
jgi:hypothetical protein